MPRRNGRPTFALALAILTLATAGCVRRSTFNEVEAELAECKQDKAAAQEAAQFCNRRYSQEVERWDDIQAVVEDVLPQTVRDFEAERDRIVALVPEQVRGEVDSYLSNFAQAVARGFDSLSNQNQEILAELQLYKSGLDQVGATTRSIDDTVTTQLKQAALDVEDAVAGKRRAARLVAETTSSIIDEVQAFDRTYISDQRSRERLRLNRNQRETVSLFHDRLVSRLVELRDASTEE